MWTENSRKVFKLLRRFWMDSIRGSLYDLQLAKTLGIALGLLAGIAFVEHWWRSILVQGIGLAYLYFLPIWFAARQGGRLAGILVSFAMATYWNASNPSNYPFVAWLMNMAVLTAVVMVFEGFERRIRQVNRQAETDGLTGLLNRGAFTAKAKEALEHAERLRTTCALVMFDCNRFKEINDVHGHAAGDQALKVLARALRDSSQGDDVIGRLGGDEFVVLLAETDSIGANLFLNRLHGRLKRDSAILPFELTVSAGIAYSGYDAKSLDMLMQVADEKMYRNKQRARAVVTIAEMAKTEEVV